MPIKILMPALSPTMEKGNLAKWTVKEGDTVKSGDVIAEIETDKATMEVEAVDEGVVAKILVPAGSQDVAVNEVIAILAGEGEDVAAAAKGGSGAPAPAAQGAATASAGGEGKLAPVANPAPATPSGGGYGAAAPAPVAAQPSAPTKAEGGRIFASPLARRVAKDKGLDLSALTGSGPHGRIILRDVEKAEPGAKPAPAAAAAPAPAPAAAAASAPKPALAAVRPTR